jgi:hypothetical protein
MEDTEIDKYINDYYSVNREQKLEYAKEYYKRDGIKEKRSEYNKRYYNERKKYVVCKKCNLIYIRHLLDIDTAENQSQKNIKKLR